ncbi:hypothetical protein NUW58_g10550 [Xylaria curta]|uniref:Uncharacterized protein n=1 Tax=Xylaria curta TaxID=42375 RepID=A0ACC1MIW8_9PEZI|nr:hypothetical protein NUW58_g10550 [Xylaria curta]
MSAVLNCSRYPTASSAPSESGFPAVWRREQLVSRCHQCLPGTLRCYGGRKHAHGERSDRDETLHPSVEIGSLLLYSTVKFSFLQRESSRFSSGRSMFICHMNVEWLNGTCASLRLSESPVLGYYGNTCKDGVNEENRGALVERITMVIEPTLSSSVYLPTITSVDGVGTFDRWNQHQASLASIDN